MAIRVAAPAKINLALHVTGRRADGYHLLDSLVAFCDVGEWVEVQPASGLTLSVTGPMAAVAPAGEANIVMKAARLLAGRNGAAITLFKEIPAGAGLGGGSSDAAAGLRGLSASWDVTLPDHATLGRLGADVPVCLGAPHPARMGGIGDVVAPAPRLPKGHVVLCHPGLMLPTTRVFAALMQRENPPLSPLPATFGTMAALAEWLAGQRNDLEAPATELLPAIATAKAALAEQPGCHLARMSGSGSAVFGLFAGAAAADAARAAVAAARPDWWLAAGRLG